MNVNKIMFKLSVLLILFGITACSSNPDFKLYEGKPLNIAVIGEIPDVKEIQISFETIDFDHLLKEDLKRYDAVFITKENLSEASESKYADVYLNSNLPFIFIEATKSYRSFIEKDLNYEDDLDLKETSKHYAIGFLSSAEEEGKYWYYGLYNDKASPENIKEMYSRIFSTIENSQ
ncbi:hypothetical protein [Halalkalibacter akibai]|uniref:Group-specific protein n=1 Tax=Halalkalibacter akibai (strain ATCC 43226 / DSM 21942 / CIP 109018 / JCM 9157 / 1139) TaxID=1236973 RepID=W4QZE6_HALA3|nr:hypothetical protein [Halalkalibacter akibai]GAE37500.1 group-specific protein [Halalkalibacter akibai JCM 9157]